MESPSENRQSILNLFFLTFLVIFVLLARIKAVLQGPLASLMLKRYWILMLSRQAAYSYGTL